MCQWLSGKVMACHVEDCGSIPGWGAEAGCGGGAAIEDQMKDLCGRAARRPAEEKPMKEGGEE